MTSASRHRRTNFNPKRRIRDTYDGLDTEEMAGRVRYTGNPAHKKDPSDFGLGQATSRRRDATLCDEIGIFRKEEAQRLLSDGARRGMISRQTRNGFPQNVWAVTEEGQPVEAQLEDQVQGTYHGYPMPENDAFREKILERWRQT